MPENAQSTIRSDLILVGQNMSLSHTSIRQPANEEIFDNSIDLLETQFSHLLTGSSASREQFMIVLSSLTEVKLRATYYNRLHPSELINFEFDVAQEFEDGKAVVPAFSAELCFCPPNFRGYSCEQCEYGYYKVKGSGPGLFNCVPCNCNGHAATCDQETGECIDCRDNTHGKNCELCKSGYHQIDYGNGVTECRLCPCPGPADSNIFAESCMFDYNSNKVYYCNCQTGYTGQFCERCAPGFYGDPTRPNGKCSPCQCNGNIDMNDYGSCDQRTGVCLKCLNNTAGMNCERCADWHYGDPIGLKSCQACACDKCGSSTCDELSGECTCHTNIVGYNCGSCGEDMWGFNECSGCHACSCDPIGSTSSQCDSRTGECSCKPGVGGKRCDQCLSDHWSFSESGCQNCQCKTAGVQVTDTGGFKCNSTSGYCTCIEGVEGKLCDQCKPRWVLVKHVGCKKCDTCVHTLLDDVEVLFLKADGIESGNKDSALTFRAQSKLVKLESEYNFIKDAVSPSQYDSTPLLNLQRAIKAIQSDLKDLKLFTEYNMNDKIKNLTGLLNDAELFNKDLNDLRMKLDVLDGIIGDLDNEDINDLRNITEEQLNVYEGIVDQIAKKDFNATLDKYKSLLHEFESANATVSELKTSFADHSSEIEAIKSKNVYIQKGLAEVKAYIEKAKSLDKFRDKDVEFKAYFDNLEQIRNETSHLQKNSATTLNQIESMIKEGQESLSSSNKDLSDLNSKVEDLQELYSDHETKYTDLKQKCQLAEQKAQSISSTGLKWQNKVLGSQNGLVAFEMAQVYEKIASTLNSAYDKSIDTLKKYSNASQSLDELIKKTEELKKRSDEVVKSSEAEASKKAKVEADYNSLNSAFGDLDKKAKHLSKNIERIDQWVGRTLANDQTLTSLKSELDNQQSDLSKSEEKADDLVRKIQSLDSLRTSFKPDSAGADGQVASQNGEQLLKSIEAKIDGLRSSGPAINSTVKKLLEENNFSSELERISKDIYDLKILIESTRQIANDIKVAVNFNDSTVLNLKSPVEIQPSMSTTGSIYLKTREVYAPIALIYNESTPNEYVALYLQQGRPHLQYKLASSDAAATVLATDVPINNGQWHKIELERVGKLAKLKVFSENANDNREDVKYASDDSVVFNLDANGAKFILGQFPISQLPNDLRTAAAYNNQFRGAMDSFKFNGHSLGLWNYASAKAIKGEINRKFVAANEQAIDASNENGIYFMEDSFMCLNNSRIKFSSKGRIDITARFRTESPNGVLWIWYNDEKQYLSVYLEQGHINVAFVNSGESKVLLFDKTPSSTSYRLDDNKYHTIKVTVTSERRKDPLSPYLIKMSVDERLDQEDEKKIDEVAHQTSRMFTIKNGKQCIGGLLATDRENIFKDTQFNSFSGCMVTITTTNNNDFRNINLQETLHDPGTKAHNVAPNCPGSSDQCEIKKSLTPVFLQFDVERYVDRSEEIVGISFVTTNPNGVLFLRDQQTDKRSKLLLELKDTKLVLTVYDEKTETNQAIKSSSKQQFNDNKLHVAYIVKKRGSIELRVDNEIEGTASLKSDMSVAPINVNRLYVAGVPESERTKSMQEAFINFEGCIIQVVYNNQELELAKANARSQNNLKFSKCYRT